MQLIWQAQGSVTVTDTAASAEYLQVQDWLILQMRNTDAEGIWGKLSTMLFLCSQFYSEPITSVGSYNCGHIKTIAGVGCANYGINEVFRTVWDTVSA